MPDYQHARDIPDRVFLMAVHRATCPPRRQWAMRWEVARILGGLDPDVWVDDVPGVPWKVVRAKFLRLEKRGLVNGCGCGCRGDFRLTGAGQRALADTAAVS